MKKIMVKVDGKWQELAGSLAYQKYNEKDRTYEWFEVNRESIEDVSLEGEAFNKDDLRKFIKTAEGKNKELAKKYLKSVYDGIKTPLITIKEQ
jgi:hypothetical protein